MTTHTRNRSSSIRIDPSRLATCGIYTKAERAAKIRRFKAKKARRSLIPKVTYECRKMFADSRPRKGGRFVTLKKDVSDPEAGESTPSRAAIPKKNSGKQRSSPPPPHVSPPTTPPWPPPPYENEYYPPSPSFTSCASLSPTREHLFMPAYLPQSTIFSTPCGHASNYSFSLPELTHCCCSCGHPPQLSASFFNGDSSEQTYPTHYSDPMPTRTIRNPEPHPHCDSLPLHTRRLSPQPTQPERDAIVQLCNLKLQSLTTNR